MPTVSVGRRSLLDAARSAVITLRSVRRDMKHDDCALDLIGEIESTIRDLERALMGDGGGLHVDARPATLND